MATWKFLGRLDHQVKLRGFRVELEEIEAVLNRQPGVRESVVVVREDVVGDKRLVAYLVMEAQQRPTINDLRTVMQAHLPEYMVPASYIFLEALPLTLNRKVDRERLPRPERDRPELETQFVAPETVTEQEVAQIWQEILGIEHVGVQDNFFGLGGHSLLVTQVISRVRTQFGVDLPIRSIFEKSTIAHMAAAIDQTRQSDTSVPAPMIARTSRQRVNVQISTRGKLTVSQKQVDQQ